MLYEDENIGRRRLLAQAGVGAAAIAGLGLVQPAVARDKRLYTRDGEDLPFKQLMKQKAIPVGENSTTGIKGSTIDVNNELLKRIPNADSPVPEDIFIHTLGNSLIKRDAFANWSRWYQEDGSTQVFRLFKDEHNVRNERKGAARIEAFTQLSWSKGDPWHLWQGTYTIIKPYRCMIFQAKNRHNDWGVSIDMTDDGDILLNHREGKDAIIARRMTGKHFLLGIRDNGHDYEVYFNKKKVGEGSFDRPEGKTNFRWGMYEGRTEPVRDDAMLFVTGVRFGSTES